MASPLFIDLFAGAGGLSLGLHAAGFDPLLAVELSPMASETYFRNFLHDDDEKWKYHAGLPLTEQIGAGLAVASTADVLCEMASVRAHLGGRELDLLAGGPPCQGFSLAGLRNPADQRNRLPFEFLTYVEALRPKLVLIENVRGIASPLANSGEKSALEQLSEALQLMSEPGYVSQILYLNTEHFGVAQTRPRVMIAAMRRDIAQTFAPGETGDDLDLALTSPAWASSSTEEAPLLAPTDFRVGPVPESVRAAIGDLCQDGYTLEVGRYPADLALAERLRIGDELRPPASAWRDAVTPPNHVARRHSPRVSLRFRLHIALAQFGVSPKVFAIGNSNITSGQRAIQLVLFELDRKRVPEPLLGPDGGPILDERSRNVGVNHAALASTILRLASAKHSQKALLADRPSPTVMSLPDDLVHFAEPRTLTVREMARLQSFPDSFVFHAKETTGSHRRRYEVPQYTQVGNAVPPLMARAIGLHLRTILDAALKGPRSLVGDHDQALEGSLAVPELSATAI